MRYNVFLFKGNEIITIMSLETNHIGLTFTNEHIEQAQNNSKLSPIEAALDFLLSKTGDDIFSSIYLAGLKYRFIDDTENGAQAVSQLLAFRWEDTDTSYQADIQSHLSLAQSFEMLRDHPAWGKSQVGWLSAFKERVLQVNQAPDSASLLDGLWLGALNVGAGVVLDDESLFQSGVDLYQMAIDSHIHPEGFLKGIVDEPDAKDTYLKQVSGTEALTLMAEIAEQASVDLWAYTNRGVSPITAATYTMYYYYYPEKWRWGDTPSLDDTRSIMAKHGAFIEIVNRRSPMRAIDLLLKDQRPFFNVFGAGLSTLTHGIPAPVKKNRWKLFG